MKFFLMHARGTNHGAQASGSLSAVADTTWLSLVRVGITLLGFLLLYLLPGCSHNRHSIPRRLPPPQVEAGKETTNDESHNHLKTVQLASVHVTSEIADREARDAAVSESLRLVSPEDLAPSDEKAEQDVSAGESIDPRQPESLGSAGLAAEHLPEPEHGHEAPQVLPLPDAIATAFRQNPHLRIYLEHVEQARGLEGMAFAPYLPMVHAGYSVGAFDLNVDGNVEPSFIPGVGSVPVGLNVNTPYQLADLKLHWLLYDFGRRSGRYRQAGLAVDIAQLQRERAFQTVATDVSVAYYQVLRARALRTTARDAVRRSESDLEETRKLEQAGVVEREKRLRVEVQLAESQRKLDAAEGTEEVAHAALNLAIGLDLHAPTEVEKHSDIPPFTPSLAECLETAVNRRREFQVARRLIQAADLGQQTARADFAPKIVAEGALFDFHQDDPRADAGLGVGAIKLEWGLFEGGKRVAELRIANSKTRAAMTQAQIVAETVEFQVIEAYRNLVTARRGIDRSRPAVDHADENYRLVRARALLGDATSAELTDAESTLTRSQQDYVNSIHDYLTALARLEYAMGVTPTPRLVVRQG